MNTLRRKLVRDLYHSKWLLLAITSIIAIGVTCFVSMQSAFHNLDRAKARYYRQCRMADFWIDLKKAPVSELALLADLPGVTEVHPRIQFYATVDLPEVVKPINALVISLPDRPARPVNGIVPRRGTYFTERRPNEVIVNDAFARAHGLAPGDWIHLLVNKRREEFLVVGTGISSEFTYLLGPGELVPDPSSFGVFYVKHTYAEELFDFEGAANQAVGLLAPDARRENSETLRRAELVLEPFGVFQVTPLRDQPSNLFLSSEIGGLGAFATVVPAIFLAVAALVLNVLINRLARQQRTVVGTLKAIGYGDWAIFGHFLSFGLMVGVVGGLAGSVLGYLSATLMTWIYRLFFEFPDLRSGFYLYTHAVGISISLVCSVLGCLYGARSMLRLQAAEAMRPEPPRSGQAIVLERWLGGLWRRLGSGWRMAIRSIFRARVRTAAGVFAAAMGAGLLVSGFMMLESSFYLLDFEFQCVTRSDVDLTFESERGRDALTEVRRLPGVDHAEPTLNVACTFVHGPYRRKGGVVGLLPDARLTIPRDVDAQPITLPESGIVISRRLASILHVDSGDEVTMIPVKGERRPVDVTIARVANSYMGLSAYAELNHLSRLVGEEFAMNAAQLTTNGRPEDLTRMYHRLKQTPAVRSVVLRRDSIDNLRETLLINQWVLIGMLVFFSGAVFFGSVVNASMVSLAERQREVATFLAMGYDPWRVGGVFLRESMLTNMTGTLLGFPVGYFLMVLTAMAYESDLLRLPVVSAPWIWLSTVGLSVLFALIAHCAVQWKIQRMDYVEALKVKE
ncbi:MAG: FtsX-like permease family protein [Planctomycetes bacterium]|nr:FtsX-like permease family protein [Planctomycetota bacterium]MBL7041946.1 FtsX-like permease family protein [Pirellulaceae bacterium]